MLREFTCIMCPQGCDISVELEGATITSITGNKCAKGEAYVTQEIEDPMRNIATSVLVDGGDLPLASVRLTDVIPKDRIFDVMAEIRTVELSAPPTWLHSTTPRDCNPRGVAFIRENGDRHLFPTGGK